LRCVAVSALLISLVLWFALPHMATYRGLSGIDSALFALLTTRIAGQSVADKNWLNLSVVSVVGIGFAAKVGFEVLSGTTLFVDSAAAGLIPVPLAHVVGGLVGMACGVWEKATENAHSFRAKSVTAVANFWPARWMDCPPSRLIKQPFPWSEAGRTMNGRPQLVARAGRKSPRSAVRGRHRR
jgi:hypothetical protein